MYRVSAASHAPYKWDYWPHEDVRAECRFVGLTNLGATCYLASTIQQLYMIPEARQAIFTAKVPSLLPSPCCDITGTTTLLLHYWNHDLTVALL